MKFSSRQPEPAQMQLAPMIDIVFLLLIFFIVTWQFTKSETEQSVALPTHQDGAEPERQRGEIVINILADGTIRVESVTMDLPKLQEKLTAIALQFKDQPVRIRGDGSVPYQYVFDVIATSDKAGIWNIAFAGQPPTPKE